MSYYMCLKCGQIFSTDADLTGGYDYYGVCPKIGCEGKVFKCDEEMLLPIQILNKKGYKTEFCCSGHAFKKLCSGYITFREELDDVSVPKGWHLDTNDKNFKNRTIRYRINDPDIAVRQRGIHRKIDSLVKWCQELPEKEESK